MNILYSDSNFQFKSDDFMVRSSMKQAILQSNFTTVYFYQFSFVGTRSDFRAIIPGKSFFNFSFESAKIIFCRMW